MAMKKQFERMKLQKSVYKLFFEKNPNDFNLNETKEAIPTLF